MEVDFRKAGSIRRRKELITALDRDPNSVDFSRERPEDIASLLKHFLCELPDPFSYVQTTRTVHCGYWWVWETSSRVISL